MAAGLSQSQLAGRIGIKQPHVANIERLWTKPSTRLLARWMDCLQSTYVPPLGTPGDLDDATARKLVEVVIVQMGLDVWTADIARVVLYPFVVWTTDPDQIAKATGLSPQFVHEKAKALRDNGVWPDDPTRMPYVDDDGPTATEITLHILAAEGKIQRQHGRTVAEGEWFPKHPGVIDPNP